MKKNTILSMLTALCAVLFLANCGGDPNSGSSGGDGGGPYVNVSSSQQNITLEGTETVNIGISSNTDWTAVSEASWLKVEPSGGSQNGTIRIHAEENNTGSSRESYIVVKPTRGNIPVNIHVTQKAKSSSQQSLSVSPSSLNFSAASGSNTFTVNTTNVSSWEAKSNQSWCTASTSGNTVTVSVTENISTDQRNATITVSGGEASPVTVSVTQSGKDYSLGVDPTTLSFVAAGETKSVTVTSNDSWTVSSNQTWCTVSPASGSNTATVNITAAANSSTSSRAATITIKGTNSGTKTISVSQEPGKPVYTLTVEPSSLSFTYSSDSKNVTVTSNDSWTVSSNKSWCTVSQTSGSNNGTIKISVTANTSTSSRTATVTVKGTNSGITKTVSVSQEGKPKEDDDIGRDDYGNDSNLNNK